MLFLDCDKTIILQNSILEDGFYVYSLGKPLEIVTLRGSHSNEVMSKALSSDVYDDKLMIKYTPTNKIYFSPLFFESNTDLIHASFRIDVKSCRVYIGSPQEFLHKIGVLAFSGSLSLNGLVTGNRCIYYNDKFLRTIKSTAKVLAVGVRDDKLYGLFYVPSTKGLGVGLLDKNSKGISVVNYKTKSFEGYNFLSIDDWFDNTMIREV